MSATTKTKTQRYWRLSLSKPVSSHNDVVATRTEDWQRLGRVVRDWREEVALTQQQIQAAGGPSTAKLREIERGDGAGTEERTKRRLEKALGWAHGSIDTVLGGGDPAPAPLRQAETGVSVPRAQGFDVEVVLVRIRRDLHADSREEIRQAAERLAQSAVDKMQLSAELIEH